MIYKPNGYSLISLKLLDGIINSYDESFFYVTDLLVQSRPIISHSDSFQDQVLNLTLIVPMVHYKGLYPP